MGIISSIIAADNIQKDGRRAIIELHTDHLGKKYQVFYRASISADINAIMLARVPSIETNLAEAEEDKLIGDVEAGLNPLNIAPDYTTVQKAHRKMVRWVMRNKAHIAVKLIPLVNWLKANYTAAQIATYLGVTTAIVLKINNRFTALEVLKPSLDTDDTYMGEI